MTHGSLFAGIGGFMLAAQWAGIENAWHSEIESYPCKLLEQQFPKSTNYGDIKTIDWSAVEPVDILTGGFPCQPFSVAGKRGGQQDDRYLWPEMFEGIQALRPRWVIGENVPGIRNLALDDVLSDLESADYTVQTLDIPACALNAPHARHRLWIVAHTDRDWQSDSALNAKAARVLGFTSYTDRQRSDNGGDRRGERRLQIDQHGQLPQAQPDGQRFECESGTAGEVGATANAKHLGPQKRRTNQRKQHEPERVHPSTKRHGGERTFANALSTGRQERHTAAFTDRQGFSRWQRDAVGYAWEAEPPVCGVDDGVPDRRHRIKGLGNAIVPQIPYVLFTYIQQIEQELWAKQEHQHIDQ